MACKYQIPFVGFAKQFCFAAATTAALDAMCGMQADLRAVFMDRAAAGPLFMLDRPADLLWREYM